MTRASTQWFERSGLLRSQTVTGRLEYRPRLGVWDAERLEEGKIVRFGWKEIVQDVPGRRCATLLDAAAYVLSPHRRKYSPNWKIGTVALAAIEKARSK